MRNISRSPHLNPLPAIVRLSQAKGAGTLLLLLLLLRTLAAARINCNRVAVASTLCRCLRKQGASLSCDTTRQAPGRPCTGH